MKVRRDFILRDTQLGSGIGQVPKDVFGLGCLEAVFHFHSKSL